MRYNEINNHIVYRAMNEEATNHNAFYDALYHRRTKGKNPMSDWGHSMFAKKTGFGDKKNTEDVIDQLNPYGQVHHTFDPKDHDPKTIVSTQSDEFKQKAYDAIKNAIENDDYHLSNHYTVVDVPSLVGSLSPNDIINSADGWDNGDIVSLIWDKVLEPNGWNAVETPDGAIVFDPDMIKTHGKIKKYDYGYEMK